MVSADLDDSRGINKASSCTVPLELALRLVQMFSFTEDTVLDPFCGSGTTMIASLRTERNSIGIEIDPDYCRMTARYLKAETAGLFSNESLAFEIAEKKRREYSVREAHDLYNVTPSKNRLK